MTEELSGTVNVEYTFREGYHIFTSPDLRGFYVASQDAEKAVSEIPEAIKLLLRLNESIECEVELPTTFESFLRLVRSADLRTHALMVPLRELGSRTYVLKCA